VSAAKTASHDRETQKEFTTEAAKLNKTINEFITYLTSLRGMRIVVSKSKHKQKPNNSRPIIMWLAKRG